jgi:hypothetical protein
MGGFISQDPVSSVQAYAPFVKCVHAWSILGFVCGKGGGGGLSGTVVCWVSGSWQVGVWLAWPTSLTVSMFGF